MAERISSEGGGEKRKKKKKNEIKVIADKD